MTFVKLQTKFGELEAEGVFAKPEDIKIQVEYLNRSFLTQKPNGSTRLLTSFAEVSQYSKPQPSLMPDVDSTLRAIAKWRYIILSDLSQSFYQIPLAQESMKYCGVATPFKGIRVYTRSAMGMPDSETCLEELMGRIFGSLIQEGIVTKLVTRTCEVRKFTMQQFRSRSYEVPFSECSSVQSLAPTRPYNCRIRGLESSEESDAEPDADHLSELTPSSHGSGTTMSSKSNKVNGVNRDTGSRDHSTIDASSGILGDEESLEPLWRSVRVKKVPQWQRKRLCSRLIQNGHNNASLRGVSQAPPI